MSQLKYLLSTCVSHSEMFVHDPHAITTIVYSDVIVDKADDIRGNV